jgi:BTB/POZ domain-containing protein KCTD9
MTARRSYEESCRHLVARGWLTVIPALPPRRPRHDDDELGVSFFRTLVADDDLSNLTLPRTFFGRSEIRRIGFRGSDLSESTLCWNDFIAVDFTECRMADADLRASTFESVRFVDADLRNVDLRRSTLDNCDITGADLRGAKLTRSQVRGLALSQHQIESIAWCDEDGDEPGGG